MGELFRQAYRCLMLAEPAAKCAATIETAAALAAGELVLDPSFPVEDFERPGRPERPVLVAPAEVPARRLSEPAGRAALLHALAHIEFNAIDLAWDAVYRFRGLPPEYYADWARIAAEEAQHFQLLCGRLASYGHAYGDFPAHDGLWQVARQTRHDVLLRMALVPRVLEARGLDVTPGMIRRLRAAGDVDSAAALQVILTDEVGHVAAGSRWFRHLCDARGLDPETTFRALVAEHMPGRVRGPLHHAARLQAGFTARELQSLEQAPPGIGEE